MSANKKFDMAKKGLFQRFAGICGALNSPRDIRHAHLNLYIINQFSSRK
jgi:hypothetical protein